MTVSVCVRYSDKARELACRVGQRVWRGHLGRVFCKHLRGVRAVLLAAIAARLLEKVAAAIEVCVCGVVVVAAVVVCACVCMCVRVCACVCVCRHAVSTRRSAHIGK